MRRSRASTRPSGEPTSSPRASDRARPHKAHLHQRDTWQAMSEESTIPDLVDRWRQSADACVRGDFNAGMSFYAPDAEWDGSDTGVGTFEGAPAIRSFLEDWIGTFEGYKHQHEVLQDLANGVVFVVLGMEGSPAGSRGRMQDRY